jgi:hypothetical protein
MSHKKAFIQRAATHFLPWLEWDMDKALAYAERAWTRLNERGYGSERKQGPRPLDDHYRALPPKQRQWFDRFWKAYNHKQGKQGAALRWGQLGKLSDAEYQHIIDAAKKDAERILPQDQVRKMAQGWLTERRWDDHAPQAAASEEDPRHARLRQLSGELAHARQLAGLGDEYWAGQAQALEQQIGELREEHAS